jgi:hypothetical protein
MWKGNTSYAQTQAAEYDEGLRSYMLGVYNYMASGLALTGIVALMVVQSTALMSLFYELQPAADGGLPYITGMKPLGWVAAFAPLAMVFLLGFKIQSMSFKGAQMAFWGFAALMGVSMADIFLMFTGTSIARVFFIAASMFGAMSLYGYTTKKDLTSWGSFLMMGVIGLIIGFVVNIFLQSTVMHFVMSGVGVILFLGLTAYDTQRIKATYYAVAGHAEAAGKAAIMGALSLYLDFINLFIMLLQFFGERR